MRTIQEYDNVILLKSQGKNSIEISALTNIPHRTIRDWFRRKPNFSFGYSKPTFTIEQFTDAVKQNLSIAGTLRQLGLRPAGANYKMVNKKVKLLNLDTSHWTGLGHLKNKTHHWSRKIPLVEMLTIDSPHQTCTIKKRIIKEKAIPYICSICHNDGNWLLKPLSLHLDHINGTNDDNRLENLRFLCPNCHSQTDSYCAKNKNRKSGV